MDYSQFSLEELKQARATLDEAAYPERVNTLDKLIAEAEQQHQSLDVETLVAESGRSVPVKFHGNTREFFSIWIVNLLLTIVTLGVYSAWAKVRTNRYFYGNTEIDGHRFSYLAEPMQILIGRAVAVTLFAAYFILSSLYPLAGGILALVLVVLTPFFVVMSYRFKMRMTAYRNVRFRFEGSYGRAFVIFVLLPFASVFTLYTILPIVLKKIDEFILSETGFGDRKFKPQLSTAEYFGTGISAVAIGLGIFFAGGIVIAILVALVAENKEAVSAVMMLVFGMYLIAFAVSSGFYTARIRNHIFAVTELSGVARFESQVEVKELIWLRMSNVLAIVVSLGFAIPWVKIRTANFYAGATYVTISNGIEDVVDTNTDTQGALGDEAATLFDVDIALG
ncbi:YjgN family protein [Aestuariibacter sp. A3R04]|uniref:YjgN family protein n=1 Tax=Aestuariibacter sp. A3R04 TaxID=2841571 RepID=UPI001C090421|nr:YjgN family protein [Aestuariibacter sp. A3R04]MBU3021686.1 DUF898 domain-containing protein [Aestuariibacter sp. A3R04]